MTTAPHPILQLCDLGKKYILEAIQVTALGTINLALSAVNTWLSWGRRVRENPPC